jgi:two-component system response regulator
MPVALPKGLKEKAQAWAVGKPIMLVEDNENDVLFMTMAMEQAGIRNPVQVVKDGREVLDYLSGKGKNADRDQYPLPYLLLLDLKLPYVMGLEVLKWIRERPQFDSTVVVVLTSSASPRDVDEAYRLHANAYLVKPSGMD